MTSTNRPDKLTLDAFNDLNLSTNTLASSRNPRGVQTAGGQNVSGFYNRFTDTLTTPILGVKSVQLLNANFVNSTLQLNDFSQLLFFYYASNTLAGLTTTATNLRLIRLLPSFYVPPSGYTAFTKNRFFASVQDLVTTLNAAASTGGDDGTYNPLWTAGQVTFSFSATTRKIAIAGNGTTFIAPAAIDDPNVQDFIAGRGAWTAATNWPVMNTINGSGTRVSGAYQPMSANISMNPRLGFSYGFRTRPIWSGANTQIGCCTPSGVPSNSSTVPVEADAYPILLGTQNVNVYLSIAQGGGYDSTNGKNLIGNIPIEVPPLCVNSYTLTSVETPCLSTPNEIYEVTVELRDEYGDPFAIPLNYNTQIVLGLHF
jgi:hypothetical protein